MNNLSESCLCIDKPSPPEFACNCSASIIFLCNICVVSHLREPKHHSFIPLDQARKIRADDEFNLRMTESQRNFMLFKSQVQAYLASISSFISDIDSVKASIIRILDEECDKKINILKAVEADVMAKAELMNQSIAASDFMLLKKYEMNGLAGVLESFPEVFKIEAEEIKHAISTMIQIDNKPDIMQSNENLDYFRKQPFKRVNQHRFDTQDLDKILNSSSPNLASISRLELVDQNKYLFIPKCGTNTLYSYDPDSNELKYHDLIRYSPHTFYRSSCCVLPDSTVMIVGGCCPSVGTTLRYNPYTFECNQLGNLNTSRGYITLAVYEGYVYAFGGQKDYGGEYMKKAERIEVNGSKWEILPDMNDARSEFGCFVKDCKIYLIGGYNSGQVEYFDTRILTFYKIEMIGIHSGSNAVGVVEDRIIILRNEKIDVYSKEFIHKSTNKLSRIINPYSLTNKVTRQGTLYFYSNSDSKIYSVDYTSNKVHELKEIFNHD